MTDRAITLPLVHALGNKNDNDNKTLTDKKYYTYVNDIHDTLHDFMYTISHTLRYTSYYYSL